MWLSNYSSPRTTNEAQHSYSQLCAKLGSGRSRAPILRFRQSIKYRSHGFGHKFMSEIISIMLVIAIQFHQHEPDSFYRTVAVAAVAGEGFQELGIDTNQPAISAVVSRGVKTRSRTGHGAPARAWVNRKRRSAFSTVSATGIPVAD